VYSGPVMTRLLPYLFPTIWLLWGVYWLIESRAVKANVWVESLPSRLMHIVPLIVAVLLFLPPTMPMLGLDRRFLPWSLSTFWAGFVVTVAGLLFTVWARRHLASNWSGDVTLKLEHELITSGPYAWVRHPIYTGLLVGFIGSAVSLGEWRGILAVLLVGSSFWRKLRTEERGMRQLFGERYLNYERRVSALIPFLL